MKILYTADDRQDAQLAADALRGLAQEVTVVWAGRLSDASRWLFEHRDLAVMIVEADVRNQSCAPLVRHVRALGLAIPVLVVVAEGRALPAAALEAGADDLVPKNQSFAANLAASARRALLRTQSEQRLQALAAETGRLRSNEARLQAALADRARSHDALEKQLNDAAETRRKLDGRLAEALTLLQDRDADVETAVVRLRLREAELGEAAAKLRTVEQRRADLEQTFNDLVLRAARDKFASMHEAAARQSDFETALAEHVARHDALDRDLAAVREELAQADAARHEAEAQYASAVTQAELAEQRHAADMTAAGVALEQARNEHAADAAAAAERAASLEAELDDLRAAGQRAAAERVVAEQLTFQRESAFAFAIAQEIAARRDVEYELATSSEKLVESESARRGAEERHSAEISSAAAILNEERTGFLARLAQASAAHTDLEQTMASLEQHHSSSMEAAAAELAARQRRYEAHLAEETAAREAVDRQLRETKAMLAEAQRDSESNTAAAAERLAGRDAELAEASAARLALEQRLVETEAALGHTRDVAVADREAAANHAARQQADFDAQIARELDARASVERDLVEMRAAGHEQFQNLSRLLAQVRTDSARELERLTNDHQREVVRMESLVAQRDGQLEDQRRELRASLAAQGQQVEALNGELQTLTQELIATRNQRDALQLEAHRAVELARQLTTSRAQLRRQFEQNPVGVLRCNHDGKLLDANHALITVLGYRSVDELRALDFPATVFDSADDFRWVIQRCQNGPRQLADCVLKKKDGGRLNMRLHAAPVSADAIEIVAEDVTSLHAAEERLREAHRMEAVGRLASEVADTCDSLLQNVSRSGEEFLAALGGDAPLRQQGETIFNDVTRATSFLRQLSAYGQKQARALSPVDVNRVLRDLEPVLKRVAGDDIELVLPRKASALNVDVEAERVERVLVNVAAYGRARMPSGGRLIVELARVAVDRNFVTKHPNVRQGGHALIRITEVKRANRTLWPIGLRDVMPAASAAAPERPGVDLGPLQTLIGDCGGHLWMNAEPGGDMEVKIRLPLRPAEQRPRMARASGRRAVARWFAS
ncbi:MAG TPA: PAS domain S-box protein [Vicinamibacterales bacterium]